MQFLIPPSPPYPSGAQNPTCTTSPWFNSKGCISYLFHSKAQFKTAPDKPGLKHSLAGLHTLTQTRLTSFCPELLWREIKVAQMWLRICSRHYTRVCFIFYPLKLKEKPISKLKNATSDPKAESWADRGAELWRAKQWAGARQLMGLGKSHKQALCAGSFSGILLLRSLCKRLNCCCLCHWMKSCRGTSEQNILSVSANAGTQPLQSGPAQQRVYGSECYKNGFVCSLQQRCSGQVHLRLKGVQLFRGRWNVWGWRWRFSTALKPGA